MNRRISVDGYKLNNIIEGKVIEKIDIIIHEEEQDPDATASFSMELYRNNYAVKILLLEMISYVEACIEAGEDDEYKRYTIKPDKGSGAIGSKITVDGYEKRNGLRYGLKHGIDAGLGYEVNVHGGEQDPESTISFSMKIRQNKTVREILLQLLFFIEECLEAGQYDEFTESVVITMIDGLTFTSKGRSSGENWRIFEGNPGSRVDCFKN